MMPRMIARDDAATYEICSVRVILLMGASEGESGESKCARVGVKVLCARMLGEKCADTRLGECVLYMLVRV